MPGGRTKFSSAWLCAIDSNQQKLSTWCHKGNDDFHAYCRFCDCQFLCDNSGKAQLLQHARKAKHIEAIKSFMDDSQGKLCFIPSQSQENGSSSTSAASSRQMSIINYRNASLTAEVIWLAKLSSCNYSFRSADDIGSTFRAMFPDSKIASTFSMSRTRASYVIGEGLGPHFTQLFVDDLNKSDTPFALHFDETSTAQVKKQMDLTVRYWSPTHNEVWVNFYTSLFFGHAEGEKVAERIYQEMIKDGIPVSKLCTLVRDGPNVNKTIFRKLQELIKVNHPNFSGFVDLGSCILHNVHNAFEKGLEEYGKDISQLCLDIHSLFKCSAARREDYQDLQRAMGLEMHHFLQHTEVRWLSLGPAVQRILEQWECICSFVQDLGKGTKPAPKSSCFRRVSAVLSNEERKKTKVQLEFIASVSHIFEEFLRMFQKSCPQVHILYDKMCEVLRKLMSRFLQKDAYVKKFRSDLADVDCSAKNQLPDSEIVIGNETRKGLSQLNSGQQKATFLSIRAFYKSSVTYLMSRLPLQNVLLKALGCLNPLKRTMESGTKAIATLARKLQNNVDVSVVKDEWHVYSVDEDVALLDTHQRVDHYWRAVFSLKSVDGAPRYSFLPKVVKASLTLAQMNAESERSLSVNGRIVTKERSHLGETTIVGLRAVKDAVKFYDPVNLKPENIPITEALKSSVRSAHMNYTKRLKEEQAEEERKEAEKMKKAQEEQRRKREQEQLCLETKSLRQKEELLNKEEQEAMNEMRTADDLLADGTKKLQQAISSSSKVDSQVAKVACLMIETAKVNQEKAKSKLASVREKQKKVNTKNKRLLDKVLPDHTSAPVSKKKR